MKKHILYYELVNKHTGATPYRNFEHIEEAILCMVNHNLKDEDWEIITVES